MAKNPAGLGDPGGGKQPAGGPVPAMPPGVRNAAGVPDGNPSREPPRPAPLVDGHPASPAVARVRAGAPAAHGQGGGK